MSEKKHTTPTEVIEDIQTRFWIAMRGLSTQQKNEIFNIALEEIKNAEVRGRESLREQVVGLSCEYPEGEAWFNQAIIKVLSLLKARQEDQSGGECAACGWSARTKKLITNGHTCPS